jgi:hypothetical protein
MFVAGCVAAAGAIYFYTKQSRTHERAALVPTVGADQVGLAIDGSF